MSAELFQIRERDQSGVLLRAGFTWKQPIAWREKFHFGAFCTSGCVALVTFPVVSAYLSATGPVRLDGLTFIALSLFALGACIFTALLMTFGVAHKWTHQIGAASFSADEIWVAEPRSLFREFLWIEWMCLRLGTSDIVSVELDSMRNVKGGHYIHGGKDGFPAYEVRLYFANGERFIVGDYLPEAEAQTVVAQLNQARREIRAAAAAAWR